uniref:EF-hand domain-containing protein n=1 Tax=uncultured Thiotrichaceae bacterium TaxID=298394 RepID=A0A6S6TE71_9GAMM|nr:MAG: Unknown protein [uncultured Thiotrichaceae bacterium]
MLKHTLVAGIMSLSFIISAPATARSGHNYERIQPANHHYQPRRHHCVAGHKINNRQANQRYRIRNGVERGKLVGWEKVTLKKQQRRIRKAEKRMRADGCLTRKEFRRLMNRLDNAGGQIRSLKSNNVRSYRHHRPRRNHR